MKAKPVAVDWKLRERRERGRDGWQTSGGVVLDVANGKLLLVQNRRERKEGRSGWTWPKGRIDPGEGPVFAAMREIVEEAGVKAEPLARVMIVHTKRALRHYYLLMKIEGGKPVQDETIAVRWVSPKKAARLLDRKRDQQVLRAAIETIAAMRKNRLPREWGSAWAA